MDPKRFPLWPADVVAIGDRVAALTPSQAAELAAYLREEYRIEAPGARPTVLNCGAAAGEPSSVRFRFRCPRNWESLRATGAGRVRFCDGCSEPVYFCTSPEEAREHAWQGHCIAVPSRLAGPLVAERERTVTMGIPIGLLSSECSVQLDGFDPAKKLSVIKTLREITRLGLKEAKDLAESAPRLVTEALDREEAERIRRKLEEAGARASLRG